MSPESSTPLPKAVVPVAATAAPARAPTAPMVGRFYRVNSSRCSFRELWRDHPNPLVLLTWLTKIFRIKLSGSVNDPNVVSLRPFVLSNDVLEARVPVAARQKIAPVVRELTELGFEDPVYFLIEDTFHGSNTVQVAMRHREARFVARISYRTEGAGGSRLHFFTEFLTGLTGNTFVHSSSARAQLLTPPQCRLNWNPRAATSELWVSHRRAVDEAREAGDAKILAVRSRRDIVQLLERHHEAVRDFQLERGVFASLRGEDLEAAEAIDRHAQDGSVRYPEIMAQLERLQNKRTNWSSAILMLLVSIGLFIAVGMKAWNQSWQMILMIVGILLVHEAGHYIAMRLFKYRNVQMFFIPFFGAAVSGHNYTAPGWKKVVVALMGPLPGIVFGSAMGIVALIKGQETLASFALLMIALNGAQLLPILPLDGGRVMHAVLFCRNYYLDTIFQVGAAGMLCFLGALTGDKILIGLGAAMIIGVGVTYKVAKIATDLRALNVGSSARLVPIGMPAHTEAIPADRPTALPIDVVGPSSAPDPIAAPPAATVAASLQPPVAPMDLIANDATIPPAVAEVIIDRTRQSFPKLNSPKQIATMTLRVYETLATKPPSVSASLGFCIVHGVSFFASIFMMLVLFVGRAGVGLGFPFGIDTSATHSVDAAAIEAWDGQAYAPFVFVDAPSPEDSEDEIVANMPNVLVATFANTTEAATAFDEVRDTASPTIRAVLFGQSLMLTAGRGEPADAGDWFDRLEPIAKDVFVASPANYASMILTCTVQDKSKSKEIVDELSDYLNIQSLGLLIPPWADATLDVRSAGERAKHDEARAIHRKLQAVNWNFDDSDELDALSQALNRATRRNDRKERDRLSKKMAEVRAAAMVQNLERIRDEEVPPEHLDFANLIIEFKKREQSEQPSLDDYSEESVLAWEKAYEKMAREKAAKLGPYLGTMEFSSERVRYLPLYGHAFETEPGKFNISISFKDMTYGAPALVKWLTSRGCIDIKYDLNNDAAYDYLDD